MSRSQRSQTWSLSPANPNRLLPGWESTHQMVAATTTVVASRPMVRPCSSNSALLPTSPCSLDSGLVGDRIEDWNQQLSNAIGRQPLPGGVRVLFPRSIDVGALGELAASEQTCCQFFDFTLRISTYQVQLDVTGPEDAQTVIASIFGVAA
jgi:hypothetical protein